MCQNDIWKLRNLIPIRRRLALLPLWLSSQWVRDVAITISESFFYPKILPDIFDVLWLSRTSLWYPSQETRKVDMQKKTRRFRKSWYDFSSEDEFLVFLLLRIVISRKLVTLFVSYLHYYFCTTKLPFYLLRASLISSYYDI